ncbi:MAG: MFS transporter [Syntrophaceae bacterium]|nr:MFS transporter [Syntrophaceae bacterium]
MNNPKKWNPTGRTRGTIIVRLRQKIATARHPPRGHGFHLDEAHLRLPPPVKPVVPGGGGWKKARSLFSFSAFHFLDDGFTDSIYLLLPFIAAELRLSFSQVGLLKGVFSGSVGLLQVPLSLLAEKIGELTVIGLGTFGLTAGFLILSRVSTFPAILLSLIFSKGTSAGQHGLSSSLLSKAFEFSRRRAAMGTYNFSGDLGKVCLPFLLTVLINLWGWREAVLTLSLAGMVGGAGLWILAGEGREHLPLTQVGEGLKLKVSGWGIGNRRRFSALLTIGIIDISTRTAMLTFLPFLLLQKGISAGQVGFAITLLFAGGATGKLFCGLLAEWFGVVPMVIATEVFTAAGILSLNFSSVPTIWILLPFVGIVLNGTSSVLYATVAEIVAPAARSRGYGLYYAITLGCGAVSPMLYGLLTDSLGLSVTIVTTALMVLLTLPLSQYLSRPGTPSSSPAEKSR